MREFIKITEYLEFFINNPPAMRVVWALIFVFLGRPEFIVLVPVAFSMQILWFLFRRK
jgi:hypothetical protein